jgi:hypothetical protein
MKSFNKQMQKTLINNELEKEIRERSSEEVMKNAEIYDLNVLKTLHEEFGFGAIRLKRFYEAFVQSYREARARYLVEGDEEKFGSRTDAYVIKQKLKEIGFDYDEITGQMVEGSGQ